MSKKSIRKQCVVGIKNRNNCLNISFEEILYIICVTLLCCGVEFGYDVPASLQVIMEKNYNLSNYEYSLFYSLYALPNLFLCFFGGFLIDSVLGIRTSTVLYMIIALVGSLFFALGGFADLIWLMLLGRLLFGLGAEMGSSVCLNYLTFTKFKNTNMNLVFSISDNFGYIGNIAVYQVSYRLFDLFKKDNSEKQSLKFVLMITSSVFLISCVCGILMTYLKSSDNSNLPEEEKEPINEKQEKIRKNIENKEFNEPRFGTKILKTIQFNILQLFKTLWEFPKMFWLLCLLSACFANAIFTFETFLQGMLTEEYGLSLTDIGYLNILLNITKILSSIPLSMLVDREGRNTIFVMMAIIIAFLAHLLLYMSVQPKICLVLLGLGYTMLGSSIVPMYAYPLKEKNYGLCYGIVTSFSNLSLFICPLIAGEIIDKFGYIAAELFYMAGLIVGFCCIVIVWILDKKSNGILTMTPQQRIEYEQIRNQQAGNDSK